MTMSWMDTIRYIGLDLQVATVFAVATLDWALRAVISPRRWREAHVSDEHAGTACGDHARPESR